MSHLDDEALVRGQYAREDNLRARQAIYGEYEGEQAPDVVFQEIAALAPQRVLEVGGGPGELAERMLRELDAEVTFVDISPRMVELARGRGIRDAQVCDVQELPFDDAAFDTAVAAWMLYHVPDLDRAFSELARVLRPGGHLVAVTNGEQHLQELRELFGPDFRSSLTRENGEELLLRHFRAVRRRDVDGAVTIRERALVVAYRDSMMTTDKSLPLEVDLPLRARTCVSIFVATK